VTAADAVILRPAAADDLWLFERQAVDPEAGGTFNWSGFRNMAALMRRFDENRLIGEDRGCLVVQCGTTVLGNVVWSEATYGMPSWRCWNIGILLLPDHRGKGFGTQAQRLLIAYLFDTTPLHRIEAYTDVENVPEQCALEKIGFTREGTLRAAQFRQGAWRDLFLYSLLRDEYKAL
jgi:RimJ/RimL family protein N-acetyltransferase